MIERRRFFGAFLMLFLLVFFGLACEENTCFHGSGETITQHQELADYHTLEVYGLFDIYLVEDSISFVVMEGGARELDFVEAQVEGQILSIYNTNSCSFLRDYQRIKLTVYSSSLSTINLLESCRISSEGALKNLLSMSAQGELSEVDITLASDHFGFYNNGESGGEFTFRGVVDEFFLLGVNLASFHTEELLMREGEIKNLSISDMYIHATELLHIQVLNRGNIWVKGDPVIEIDSIEGPGKLLTW